MSEINQLVEKIMAEAANEEAAILSEAAIEKENLLLVAQEEVMVQNQKHLTKSRENMENMSQQTLSKAQLTARNELLGLKQQEIEKVFAEATNQLKNLDQKALSDFIQKKIKEVPLTGEMTLTMGEYTADKLDQVALENIKSQLTADKKVVFTSHNLPGKSGFIINQSGIEYNFMFEDMIQMLQEDMVPEISAILFK